MRVMATNSWCVVLVLLCLYNMISFSKAHNNGFSVEIIHRDSPRSPLYRSMETKFERVANAVRRSINRAHHLRKYSISPNTAEAPVVAGGGEYLMIYSVGTPPFQLYGVIDTGSNIVWLQCQPCEQCYNQTTPIFDPSKSKSYKTLPCTSTTCQSVAGNSCGQNCEYSISYADGSVSQGDLSVDTLTLGSTSGSSVQFPRTVLGCGHKNTGLFRGKTSGIVGLSGGPVSLITQLSSSIAGKFSYCLAPMFTESDSSSKLNFGDAAVVSGAGTVSTPIVQQADHIFYFLNLEALSVGNNRIEFGNSSSSDGEGNIIIDSGSTLTYLPDDMYSNLESAVADAVKLERVDDPNQELSLCFESTSDEPDVPVITAHFTGADVQLNPINTFIQVADKIICLAFQASEDQPIFGNVAQQNLLVGYDLQKNTLSFKPTDCTKQ